MKGLKQSSFWKLRSHGPRHTLALACDVPESVAGLVADEKEKEDTLKINTGPLSG